VGHARIPVIDIAGLKSPRLDDRLAVAAEIRAACLYNGFFYIAKHGVAPVLIEHVFNEAKAFFALPMEAKLARDMSKSTANRGYERLGGQTLEAGAPPDLKEGFYIGPEHDPNDEKVKSGKFNHGPNQWPKELPGFRETMEAYFAAMRTIAERLMCGLALSLDLPETYFARFCEEAMATLRLLHYPPQPASAAPDQKGAGAHTDFGGLTLLAQDDAGGLEVWDLASDSWIRAKPISDTFVVNLGDMIARWTNDRYRSTLHRVVNVSGRARYSIPFFYVGNYDHEVACLPTCLDPGKPPKYAPTTVEAHLREMYRRTYAPKR
jgi:isopenicillin N synthase-like dioxygenase